MPSMLSFRSSNQILIHPSRVLTGGVFHYNEKSNLILRRTEGSNCRRGLPRETMIFPSKFKQSVKKPLFPLQSPFFQVE